MSPLSCILLCIQACLIQNVFSACYGAGPVGAYGWEAGLGSPYGWGPGIAAPYGIAPYAGPYGPGSAPCGCSTYGGAGLGNVAVTGELPVGGATAVAGQVPIIGGVEFGGAVPAAGAVIISGSCACGCSAPYGFLY